MGDPSTELVLGFAFAAFLFAIVSIALFFSRRKSARKCESLGTGGLSEFRGGSKQRKEDLVTFLGGEDLTIYDILDAPGEVIGKSRHGTVYRANLERRNRFRVLRFVQPNDSGAMGEVVSVVRLVGLVRHHNLVPLEAFYAGSRGEKLLVYPFYGYGNLAQFIREGKTESHKWDVIYDLSIGIAKGLDHLHTGLHKPLVHGNLKSKNILLGRNFRPYLSDFGLHLLLNPVAAQGMLESAASDGYKAPELIKMKDVNPKTDIYSFGVILLELLTGKEPISKNLSPVPNLHLPNTMRNAILDHRITDLLHPGMVLDPNHDEERTVKFFHLAMDCCSPSPSLRPDIKRVLRQLEELGKGS